MNTVSVKVEATLPPAYATAGAAGMDLRASEPAHLDPGRFALVKTGLRIELPQGYEAQIRSRSGLALKSGVFVLNAPGTIDSDYRGEVGVILANFGSQPFSVEVGDRIAQMVVQKVERVVWEVADLSVSERGDGGFGSTGVS